MNAFLPSLPTIVALVKIGLLIGGLMTAAAYLVLVERWMAAWVQDRKGPNRVGIPLTKIRLFGLGQPLADGLKIILKEDFTPRHVDKVLYTAAPLVILAASLAIFAAIPFGSALPPIPALGLDVGVLWVFALSSIAVYGVLLGGWASNNKYGFLGGLRSSAQLVAYEIPLGLGLLGVVLAAGSLKLDAIMGAQADSGVWYAFAQPLGFVVFLVASFAEAARLPFDLPEAEQELVGGYHTEYSGIKLLLFLVAEFLHMVTAAFLIVIMFLGGWHLWGVTGSGAVETWTVALIRALELAAVSLRPADESGLEGDAASGTREPGRRRRGGGVPAPDHGRGRRRLGSDGDAGPALGRVRARLAGGRPAHAVGHRQRADPHARPARHRARTGGGVT
jgi:NADH-quinone oxidoreductase subunit H